MKLHSQMKGYKLCHFYFDLWQQLYTDSLKDNNRVLQAAIWLYFSLIQSSMMDSSIHAFSLTAMM